MAVTEKKITLIEPIKDGEERVTELTMKKMTVGMMLDANVQCYTDYGIEPTKAMVEPYAYAIACDVPLDLILSMGFGPDYGQLMDTNVFLTKGGKEDEVAEVEETKDEAGQPPAKKGAKDDPDSPEEKTSSGR